MLRKNEAKQLLLVVFSWCFSLGWKSYEGSKSHAKSATSKKWFGFPISKKREVKMYVLNEIIAWALLLLQEEFNLRCIVEGAVEQLKALFYQIWLRASE